MPDGPDDGERTGPYVSAINADGGWFGPGDDLERACDEAEAILLAVEDLDGVMEVIREAESPVEARRALKIGFGFTGRQAALLLTLPVLSFTRSERRRLDAGRRARVELLADVTGVLPAIPAEAEVEAAAAGAGDDDSFGADGFYGREDSYARDDSYTRNGSYDHDAAADRDGAAEAAPSADGLSAAADEWNSNFGAAFDGVLADINSAMAEPVAETPPLLSAPPAPGSAPGSEAEPRPRLAPDSGPRRRSMSGSEEASTVLDEQIGELTDALAALIGVAPPSGVWFDDPRSSSDESGAQLDRCGVNDETGLRTLLWHLHRTGLDSVEGLFPFAEPLPAGRGFDAQSVMFESAMSARELGSRPGSDVRWASGLWPIAERRGYGYAVAFGGGPDAGSVWAYGGGEPLHRLWDSVVDLLVEVYQSLMTGAPCDSAVATPVDGRVVWTNLS